MKTNYRIQKLVILIVLPSLLVALFPLQSIAFAIDHTDADYIMIIHETLAGVGLANLIDHKSSLGFTVYVDTISDGMSNSSIKDLIQEAYYQGKRMPQYLLLIGSCAFDTTEGDSLANAQKGNFVPTFYAEDYFGWRTAYDQTYGEVDTVANRYRLSHIHIGRLPVQTDDELQAYVDKLIFYESDTCDQNWKDNILLLAGDKYRGPFPDYPSQGMVNSHTQKLATEYIPDGMSETILHYSDFSTDQERKDTTVQLIDQGQLMINALGTGSDRGNLVYFLDRYGSEADFNALVDLSNSNKYPVVIGASCHLAQFDMPIKDTLLNSYTTINQNLLFAPEKGAIAFIGGTGATSEFGNFDFTEYLFENIFDNHITNLGQLAAATKLKTHTEGSGSATARMYAILGDPSLNLSFNSDFSAPFTYSGFEIIDPVCCQHKCQGCQYVNNPIGKVELVDYDYYIEDKNRWFKVEGTDYGSHVSHNSYLYWILYDDLTVPVDSSSRFLSFILRVDDSPEGDGHISLDANTTSGQPLREDTNIVDQYGQRIHPAYHYCTAQGMWEFFAFDLSPVYGDTITRLLVAYDDYYPGETGYFLAYIDRLRFSPHWGSPPEVSNIMMSSAIYVNNNYAISVLASDEDTLINGDSLSYTWWLTGPPSEDLGYITGSGPTVTYHAPSSPVNNVTIHVSVTDKGAHQVDRSKTFDVEEEPPPSGCPYVYFWNGEVFINENVILTASEDESTDRSAITDYCVFSQPLIPKEGRYELEIREFENEISKIDYIKLLAVDYPYKNEIGVTPEGKVWAYSMDVSPIGCIDQDGVDRLEEVKEKDRKYFVSKSPGHLIVNFGDISRIHFFKPTAPMADGGGTGVDPPPKNAEKVALLGDEEVRRNIVYVDVLDAKGEWQNTARVCPRTSKVLTLVELSQFAKAGEDLKIRIRWTKYFSADYIPYYFLRDDEVTITPLLVLTAWHSEAQDITSLVESKDDSETILSPNQKIKLSFESLPDNLSKQRRFVLVAKGYYETIGKEETFPKESDLVFRVYQNYPNPFNPRTVIKYNLPEQTRVTVNVYNILGQLVKTLVDKVQDPGLHETIWEGKNDSGKKVSNGIYFYRIQTEDFVEVKKMVFIK